MAEKNRLTQIRRTVRLIRDLQRGTPHDVYSAAKLLSVKPSTADRQLKAIELELQGEVTSSRENGRRTWRSKRKVDVLRDSQLISTCLGASLAPVFEGSAYAVEMRRSRSQVTKLASREERFADADRKFWFVPRGGEVNLPDRAGLLDEIIDGLLAVTELDVKYERFNGNIEQLVLQPLSLAIYDHQLYVVAQKRGSSTKHPYRFSRVHDVEGNDTPFTYPPRADYDPSATFGHSFGIHLNDGQAPIDVVLKLARRWATYARHHCWHKSQQVDIVGEFVEVRMHVRICEELKAWIRGFGNEATVEAPEALRAEIFSTSLAQVVTGSVGGGRPRERR